MDSYTHREMADMHLIYSMDNCNGRESLRLYREKYSCRKVPSSSFFATLHRRDDCMKPDRSTCTSRMLVANKRLGQLMQKKELSKNSCVIELYPERSISPKATVWRIVCETKDYTLIIYNASRHWNRETKNRMEFARWFLQEHAADRNFAASVLFTDEFLLEGVINFHHMHAWMDENPHATRSHGAQRECSVNVWVGIIGDCLLGPYLPPERLNGPIYLTFLQEVLLEMLNDAPMRIRRRIQFQRNGASVHFSRDVGAHLQATFLGGWIGRGGPIAWPLRSPELSTLDFFFLWGFLKGLVYEIPVETPVGRIVVEAGCVRDTPGNFEKLWRSMQRR